MDICFKPTELSVGQEITEEDFNTFKEKFKGKGKKKVINRVSTKDCENYTEYTVVGNHRFLLLKPKLKGNVMYRVVQIKK